MVAKKKPGLTSRLFCTYAVGIFAHLNMSKLYIKNKEVNFSRKIDKIIKDSGIISEADIVGNISKLYDIYHFDKNYSLKFVCQIININYLESKLIIKYVKKCGEDNFCYDRFKEYLIYRGTNPSDCTSEKYFKLVHGDDYLKFFKQKSTSGFAKIYDPNYIMSKHNLAYDQALEHIKQYKKNKATSKQNFVKKYGEEEGLKKFQQFQQTSKHTKDKYIKQYGKIEGIKKWKEYVKAKQITSPRTIEYWLSKYSDPEIAEAHRKEYHREHYNSSSVDFWVKRGMSVEQAVEKVKKIMLKKQVSFCNASKESLKYFQPLHDYLTSISKKVMMGVEGNEEMLIYSPEERRIKFYDFAIFPDKIIIEFHGYKFHPNPDKLSSGEWNAWKVGRLDRNFDISNFLTADQAYAKDLAKKELAISKGFKYLIIWSNDKKEDNLNKIINFLKQNNIIINKNIF